jgi:hypothetical protein
VIPVTDDAVYPDDYISINEYMMRMMDQCHTPPTDNDDLSSMRQHKTAEKPRCKQCLMYEQRDIESDLTLILEVQYNDLLEEILAQKPELHSQVHALCDLVKELRNMTPHEVWLEQAKFVAVHTACPVMN